MVFELRGAVQQDQVAERRVGKDHPGQVVLLLGMARGLLRTAEDANRALESNRDLIK
jgi:hypothetical protein